ncbi:hypothetical protein AGMMS50262_13800 [Bacteroidia bacterium]|nr:hypothetical protein AGMMS50262_13800 [Bacteroidia bacterium]
MRNDDSILKELQNSLASIDGSLCVLDTTLSVDKQMEYFRYMEKIRESDLNLTAEEQVAILQSDDTSLKEKKILMAAMAISGDVKAYRALENYGEEVQDKELKEWASLSLAQAKITLEFEFSGEKKIFISTGLGGKGTKLRYYAFFKSNRLKVFSDYQRDLIEKEFLYSINKSQGIVEEIKIEDNYFNILFLLDFQADVKYSLARAIEECNQYGDFINDHFIITNVKVFDKEDIRRELQRNG